MSATDKLILVKHAMPVIDVDSAPRTWPLSDAGRAAATRLAPTLAVYQPTGVITSDEPKAIETGQIIATHLTVPAVVRPGLHEHERDVLPFVSTAEFDQILRNVVARPDAIVYGNESADAAHLRFEIAIRSVVANEPTGTLVIVAHGTVIALFVARANGLDPFPLWKRLGLPSFVVIERDSFRMDSQG